MRKKPDKARDKRILELHSEGRTQVQIAAEIKKGQSTVFDRLKYYKALGVIEGKVIDWDKFEQAPLIKPRAPASTVITEVTLSRKNEVAKERKNKEENRQSYYIPIELHMRLKIASIRQGRNISELVVAGIELILKQDEDI